MPRPRNPTIMGAWKLYMPAPLTAKIELLLFDPLTRKAKHGERARITALLWEEYLSKISGKEERGKHIITIPRLEGASFEFEGHLFTFRELKAKLNG